MPEDGDCNSIGSADEPPPTVTRRLRAIHAFPLFPLPRIRPATTAPLAVHAPGKPGY